MSAPILEESGALSAPMAAVAQLIGEARLNILTARTVVAISVLREAREDAYDWREIGDSTTVHDLIALIRRGYIRRDAEWSRGADAHLIRLADIADGRAEA